MDSRAVNGGMPWSGSTELIAAPPPPLETEATVVAVALELLRVFEPEELFPLPLPLPLPLNGIFGAGVSPASGVAAEALPLPPPALRRIFNNSINGFDAAAAAVDCACGCG